MKVVNNGMLQAYIAGLADLMPQARAAGLPLETVMRILAGGPAGLPMLADRIPKVLGEDMSVGFDIRSTFKDNRVFLDVLESYGLTSPTLARFRLQEGAVGKAGFWERDAAALVSLAYYGVEDS